MRWIQCQQLMEGALLLIENTYNIEKRKAWISSLQIRNITKCKKGKWGEMWNLKARMFDVVYNCQSVFDTNLVGLKEEIFISLFMQHILGEEMVIKWKNHWGTFLAAHFSYLLWYSTFKHTLSFWLNDFCHCNKTFWNFIFV